MAFMMVPMRRHVVAAPWWRLLVVALAGEVLPAPPSRAGELVVKAPESIVRSAPFDVAPELARLRAGDQPVRASPIDRKTSRVTAEASSNRGWLSSRVALLRR